MNTPPRRRRTLLLALLLGLLLADTAYTGWQFYRQPLDGDMAWNLLPDPTVAPILDDPLGWGPLTRGETYANPNRFFCHWAFRGYLLHAPLTLHRFTTPVNAVYWACTLAKLFLHGWLLLLLGRMITGGWRWRTPAFVGTLCLLFPLFQTSGYRGQLGIVDPSTTYAFFYALPAGVLLAFLLPFTDRLLHERERPVLLSSALLAPVVCLSGPLNPGVVLVLTVLLAGALMRGQRWPRRYWLGWGWAAALAAYSLWLGRYNSLSIASELPLGELYARLPRGAFNLLTTKLGWPLLLGGLAVNFVLLAPRYRKFYGWVVAFALLYCLLLPLGGYRSYRPELLRYDTILPVTLGAVLLYGWGALRLLRAGSRRWYWLLPVAVGAAFTLADGPPRPTNACERDALERMAAAPPAAAPLEVDCPVLLWESLTDPAASRDNAELIRRWGIRAEGMEYYVAP